MDMTSIIDLIQGVGFPIGVSIYLLLYMKTEMKENREALNDLRLAITSLSEFLKQQKKE